MIVFYFDTALATPGGVQTLIINITRKFTDRGEGVKIITRKSSFVYQVAAKKNLNFQFINIDEQFEDFVTADDIIILFGFFEPILKRLIDTNARIFFWSVATTTLVFIFGIRIPFTSRGVNNSNFLSRTYAKKLARLLSASRSGYFMDQTHISVIDHFGLKTYFDERNLLPVPVFIPNPVHVKQLPDLANSPLHIAYLGRSEEWKVFPCLRLILDIDQMKSAFDWHLHIITEDEIRFRDFVAKYISDAAHITITYHSALSGDKLDTFLMENIHVLFGMGISLLEGCKASIPSIVVDPCYSHETPNAYRFVYNEAGFVLSCPSWLSTDIYKPASHNLPDLFDDILKEQETYEAYCRRSYDYVNKNHNIDPWFPMFVNLIDNATARISQMKFANRFFKTRRWFYNVFESLAGRVKSL